MKTMQPSQGLKLEPQNLSLVFHMHSDIQSKIMHLKVELDRNLREKKKAKQKQNPLPHKPAPCPLLLLDFSFHHLISYRIMYLFSLWSDLSHGSISFLKTLICFCFHLALLEK